MVTGSSGFVGGAVVARLRGEGVRVLALGRTDVDLAESGAAEKLARLLEPGDALVAAAARAPVRNVDMLVENLIIARAMSRAAGSIASHVINVSSDAIYGDSPEALTELSSAAPDSLHGIMHLARELIFRTEVKAPLAILRPTLIYGPGDPHNGYGPNRFRRLAAQGADIALFGNGEERRDHVYIDDVAELVVRVLFRRSSGSLNIATGEVHSFKEIADTVRELSQGAGKVTSTPRTGPMPHGGYRAFDIAACRAAFPDFRFVPLRAGLIRSRSAG